MNLYLQYLNLYALFRSGVRPPGVDPLVDEDKAWTRAQAVHDAIGSEPPMDRVTFETVMGDALATKMG